MKNIFIIASTALLISACATAPKATKTESSTAKKQAVNKATAMTKKAMSGYENLDAKCLPVPRGIENRIKAPTYLRVIDAGEKNEEDKQKNVKLNNEYYAHVEGSEWEKLSPINASLKDILKGIKSGKISLTNCKPLEEETLDGKKVNVLSYDLAMAFTPKLTIKKKIKQYTGKTDGLPYKEIETVDMPGMKKLPGAKKVVTYKYDKASIPKVK